jgi:hypothetical protein
VSQSPTLPYSLLPVQKGARAAVYTKIVVTTPISLTVNSEVWLIFMRQSTLPKALAVGFCSTKALSRAWMKSLTRTHSR